MLLTAHDKNKQTGHNQGDQRLPQGVQNESYQRDFNDFILKLSVAIT